MKKRPRDPDANQHPRNDGDGRSVDDFLQRIEARVQRHQQKLSKGESSQPVSETIASETEDINELEDDESEYEDLDTVPEVQRVTKKSARMEMANSIRQG